MSIRLLLAQHVRAGTTSPSTSLRRCWNEAPDPTYSPPLSATQPCFLLSSHAGFFQTLLPSHGVFERAASSTWGSLPSLLLSQLLDVLQVSGHFLREALLDSSAWLISSFIACLPCCHSRELSDNLLGSLIHFVRVIVRPCFPGTVLICDLLSHCIY